MDNTPKLSKSAIGTYDSCPHQYKLRYIMGMQPAPSPIMQRGTEIHDLCDTFFDGVNTMEGAVNKLLQSELALKYKDQMKNFISFIKHIGNGKFRTPLMKEKKFFNEEWNFTFISDAIYEDDQGNLLLLDYKTGKTRGVSHHRFELAVYVFFTEILLNRKIKFWGILFLDEPDFSKAFDYEEVIPKEIEKAKLKIKNTRMKIRMEQFPKKPKYGCEWCGFYGNGCEGK